MFLCANCKPFGLTVSIILLAVSFTAAQGTNTVFCGNVSKLSVKDKPGNIFFWKIYSDRSLTSEVSTSDVEFLQGNSGPEVTVKWGKNGIYYFMVQSFNLFGCSNQKVGKMKVLATSIDANAGADTIIGSCKNIKLDGTGSKGEIVKYEWVPIDLGGSITNGEGKWTVFSLSSQYTGVLPANFRIRLTVTDRSGKTDMDTLVVKTDIRPDAKIVYSELIDKNGHKLADGSTSTGTSITYNWAVENGSITGDPNSPNIIVSFPGCYSLLVRDKYGCESYTAQKVSDIQNVIRENPDYGRCTWDQDLILPVLSNDYSSFNNIKPETLEITINPSHGTVKVLSNGNVLYSPLSNFTGKDIFSYKISDVNHLSDSTKVTIDVDDAPIAIAQGLSPNGDGLNDFLVFKGLENYPGSELTIFTKDGQVLFKSSNYQNDWSGNYLKSGANSQDKVNQGVYYYSLRLGSTNRILKGFLYVAY